MTTRIIRCRCGFVVLAWDYDANPKVDPVSNRDRIFENIRAHRKWWRGHWVRFIEV